MEKANVGAVSVGGKRYCILWSEEDHEAFAVGPLPKGPSTQVGGGDFIEGSFVKANTKEEAKEAVEAALIRLLEQGQLD